MGPPRRIRHGAEACWRVRWTVLVLAMALVASAQTQPRTPEELILDITGQSGLTETPAATALRMGLFSCGFPASVAHDSRGLAKGLVDLGASATPSLEAALTSIEHQGSESPYAVNADWLLLAYAKILGPKAQRRIQDMIGVSRLHNWAVALDESMALSLGLTSYLSSWRDLPCPPNEPECRVPVRMFRCDPAQPREALDRLILAFEHGNLPLLEATLGPRAEASFDRLIAPKKFPRHLGVSAVGYRFNIEGQWSEPEETLEEGRASTTLPGSYTRFSLETDFMVTASRRCAEMQVDFVATGTGGGDRSYLVDNPDVGKLLETIADCAVDLSARH